MINSVAPMFVVLCVLSCLWRKKQVYEIFQDGVKDGMKTVIKILPPLVAVMSSYAMMKESGIMEYLTKLLIWILPFETDSQILTMGMLKSISGSGAMGVLTEVLKTNGPDSEVGRICSVICASSETTLYVMMVYFGATRVKYTKRVLLAALIGDIVCVFAAILTNKIFF